jgi:hypothetical protein
MKTLHIAAIAAIHAVAAIQNKTCVLLPCP